MLKKENDVKWSENARKSSILVKFYLTIALVLTSLDYSLDFIISYFASDHTLAAVLMQKKMGQSCQYHSSVAQ